MKIRRIQYNIDYIHILTFREEYKKAVIPYFGFSGLRYGIDNEGTIHESIRLIFPSECIAISLRKEGITFVFEGEVSDVKSQSGIIKPYWDLFEKIKTFEGFRKPTKHSIVVHSVDILDESKIDAIMNNNKYLNVNPFGQLDEFCCIYEFKKDGQDIKFQFGNFSPKDIDKNDLTPFKSQYNNDLISGKGLITRVETSALNETPSFSKFKQLLSSVEKLIIDFENYGKHN